MSALVLQRRKGKSLSNRHVGECFRCEVRVPEGEGTFFMGPLRLVCAACVLREGVRDDNGFALRLAQLPRESGGKTLNLMPFQIEDCRRIATTKALLIGSQMGTGKTVQAAMAALRGDTPNIVFCPASVRENWADEIQKWRPDLAENVNVCQSQFGFFSEIDSLLKTPGGVLVCSFGVLPGSPCRGCRSLRTKLRQLKKWKLELCPACESEKGSEVTLKVDGKCFSCGGATMKIESPRYHSSWYPQCNHYPSREKGVDHHAHPPFVDLRIDKRNLRLPYHPKGDVDSWIASGVELPDRGKIPGPELLAPPIEKNGCWKDGVNESGGCWQANPMPDINVPVTLLADECHAFKNPSNERTRNWRGLRERVWEAGGSVFGLTGTPCEGKPMEFWEVLRSLGLEKASFGTWENYHRIFKHWFENPKGSRMPPQGALRDELHARLKRIQINRRRKDVLQQLPPRQEQVIHVDINEKTINEVNEAVHRMLSVKQAWEDVQTGAMFNGQRMLNPFDPRITVDERQRRRLIYDQAVEYYFDNRPALEDAEIQEAVDQALMSKGQMPTIDQLSRIRAMLSKAKVKAVTEWIQDREEEDEPVVVFSQHVSILKKLAQRPGWECFHGGLSPKKRSQLVKDFQSGKIERGLCVSIGAGGEGITLTRAAVCAEIDLSWNPAKNQQAESRLIRIGAEQHNDKAADEAWERIRTGSFHECDQSAPCRAEEETSKKTGEIKTVAVPCAVHQARILVVRFVARHVVDELVMLTLKEKESLLASLEWEEEEQS